MARVARNPCKNHSRHSCKHRPHSSGFCRCNRRPSRNHERAVADGVNVGYEVYRIKTQVTEQGGKVEKGFYVDRRSKETRAVRWERLDEDLTYAAKDLDRSVVVKSQIRTVLQAFKDALFTELFPGRTLVPKTLIFCKDDSHAEDTVHLVREVFGKGNDFAKKITYKTYNPETKRYEKSETLIQEFRTSPQLRIAVTVDMIATGTDIKPLECLLFLRDTRSRTYFEQMKGRGTRVLTPTDLQAVSGADARAKTHFVIVDAVGVCESDKTDSRPLERQRTVAFDKLLLGVALGKRDEDTLTTLAGRLARLDREVNRWGQPRTFPPHSAHSKLGLPHPIEFSLPTGSLLVLGFSKSGPSHDYSAAGLGAELVVELVVEGNHDENVSLQVGAAFRSAALPYGGACGGNQNRPGTVSRAAAMVDGCALRHVHPLGARSASRARRSGGRAARRCPPRITTTSTSNSTRRISTPTQWVKIAKAAGMKYIVLTTKHHDGFCLWDTKLTDYNIMNTPFHRDVMKELAEACRKQGIAFCPYYSVCDWCHPDYPLGSPGGKSQKPAPNMERYNQYLKGQVTELLKNYGPLGVLWFDGEWESPWTVERGQDLYRHCRSLQDSLIVNNRVGKGREGMAGTTAQTRENPGDYDTPEQTIGKFQDQRPWETCMTICNQWAWKPNDPMKSLPECLHALDPVRRRRRQPAVQRRPDADRRNRATSGRAAQGNGRVAGQERRKHLRHARRSLEIDQDPRQHPQGQHHLPPLAQRLRSPR